MQPFLQKTSARTSFVFLLLLMLIFAAVILLSPTASAQMSVQESDGDNRFKLLGKTWSPNFFSLASTETDKMNDEGGRISSYNYLSFGTYVGQDYRFALRLPFQYNTAGSDRFNGEKLNEAEFLVQDPILSLQNYNLAMLPWDLGLYWEGRIYLPFSEQAKKTEMITRLRNHFIVNKVFSRYAEIEYSQKYSYYVQSRSTYENTFEDEYGFEKTIVSSTKQSELDHAFQLWGKVTPQAGLGWSLGWEDTYWNKSEAENKSKAPEHLIKTGPITRFPITDSANFILAYEDKVNREINPGELGKFLAKNTSFVLLSFIRF